MALQEVTVISHHAHTHKDKHHGIEYVFEPNKKVQVPLAAAVHFFGVGLPADAPARQASWKRHGLTDDAKGEAYLKKFECKVVDLVPAGDEVAALREETDKNLAEFKKEHESELTSLEADHREEIQRINKTHADEVAALKTRIVELKGPAPGGETHKAK